jgi:hypothetical protein
MMTKPELTRYAEMLDTNPNILMVHQVKRECLRWLILKSLAKDRDVVLNFSYSGGSRDECRNEAAFRDNHRCRALSSQKRKLSADADGGSEEEEGSEEEGSERGGRKRGD